MERNYIYTVETRWDEKDGTRSCQNYKIAYTACSSAMSEIANVVHNNGELWECEKPKGLNCILQMKGYGTFPFMGKNDELEPVNGVCTIRLEKIAIKGEIGNESCMAEAIG